jgi:hypothetical protein
VVYVKVAMPTAARVCDRSGVRQDTIGAPPRRPSGSFETSDADADDLAVYRRLLTVAAPKATGDVSSQYSAISDEGVARILSQLSDTWFLFLVREPVWGGLVPGVHAVHLVGHPVEPARAQGTVPEKVMEDPATLAEYIPVPGSVPARGVRAHRARR